MTAPTDAERALQSTVVAWNSFRIAAKALRAQRAGFLCERTEKAEVADGAPIFERGAPCWKWWDTIHADEGGSGLPERLPREEWCASCLSRQIVHEGYRAAVRQRGVEMRRMQHYAGKVKP